MFHFFYRNIIKWFRDHKLQDVFPTLTSMPGIYGIPMKYVHDCFFILSVNIYKPMRIPNPVMFYPNYSLLHDLH